MGTRPSAAVPPSPAVATPGPEWPLRACLVLNLVGAAVPGMVLLADPSLAPEVTGATADAEVARLVGAIWTAMGVVSLAALRRPREARGLLAVQVVYKTVYVAAVGLPAILAGTASPTTVALTAGFATIATGWTAALVATRRPR